MTRTATTRLTGIALAFGLICTSACGGDKKDSDKDAEASKDDDSKSDDKKAGGDAADGDEAAEGGEKAEGGEAAGDGGGAAVAPGEAGPAYIAVNMKGIAKLDGGSWSLISGDKNRIVSDMFVGPDNNVYVLDFQGLHKINGDKLEQVVKFGFKDIGSVSHLAMAKPDELWAVNYKGVGHYTGGSWTLTEKEKIAGGVDMLTDVAVTGDGKPFISSSKTILGLEGEEWANVDLSVLGDKPYIYRLATAPDGTVWGQTSRELVKFGGEKAEKVEIKTKNFMGYGAAMEFGPNGNVAMSSSLCDLARVDPAKPEEVWTMSKEDLSCLSFEALGLDGQNRVWIASREGLSVVDSEKKVTDYGSGTVMDLVGRVSHIVVVGKGPELPAPGEAHTAGVKGKVLMDGTAIADAKIEMCPSPQIFGSGTPCSASKVKFSGTTSESGEFSFDKVPMGDYNVAVEIDGKWRSNYIPSFATKMTEGETYDVGAVTYSKM